MLILIKKIILHHQDFPITYNNNYSKVLLFQRINVETPPYLTGSRFNDRRIRDKTSKQMTYVKWTLKQHHTSRSLIYFVTY